MIKAHVIKLYPTKSQELLLRKSCGIARYYFYGFIFILLLKVNSMKCKDLTGVSFGKLIVIKYCGLNNKNRSYWKCLCECGNISYPTTQNLQRKNGVKSCGCEVGKKFKPANQLTHGYTSKNASSEQRRTFGIWSNMIQRCTNKKSPIYQYYGGRGINVCGRWLESFENFLVDMGMPSTNKHTIDRYPNNDGNYEPGNCRWATMKEQSQNRRENWSKRKRNNYGQFA